MKRKYNPIIYQDISKDFRFNENGVLERIVYGRTWREVILKPNKSTHYVNVKYHGESVPLHRIIWSLYHKKDIPFGYQIDHINGDTTDNSIDNLRLTNQRENSQNRIEHRNGKLVGCSFMERANLWQAYIIVDSHSIHVGYYHTAEEAHKAYEIACQEFQSIISSQSFKEDLRTTVKRRIQNETSKAC